MHVLRCPGAESLHRMMSNVRSSYTCLCLYMALMVFSMLVMILVRARDALCCLLPLLTRPSLRRKFGVDWGTGSSLSWRASSTSSWSWKCAFRFVSAAGYDNTYAVLELIPPCLQKYFFNWVNVVDLLVTVLCLVFFALFIQENGPLSKVGVGSWFAVPFSS